MFSFILVQILLICLRNMSLLYTKLLHRYSPRKVANICHSISINILHLFSHFLNHSRMLYLRNEPIRTYLPLYSCFYIEIFFVYSLISFITFVVFVYPFLIIFNLSQGFLQSHSSYQIKNCSQVLESSECFYILLSFSQIFSEQTYDL